MSEMVFTAEAYAKLETMWREERDARREAEKRLAEGVTCQKCGYNAAIEQWGCFCELEPHEPPQPCVIDDDRRHDCTMAGVGAKEACEFWRKW